MTRAYTLYQKGTAKHHQAEADRIQQELGRLVNDARFADDGIVKTVLRRRVLQEQERAAIAEQEASR